MRKKDPWIKTRWRPMMAWIYMAIILFDFMIAPVFWTVWQANYATGIVAQQWIPITLAAGGLFHVAMGAILGVTAWSRGQEKLQGVDSDSYVRTEEALSDDPEK